MENLGKYQKQLKALLSDSGNEWKALYKEARPMVFNYVMNNSGSRQNAEDLLQEGMCILLDKIKTPGFVLTSKPTTFLYSICRYRWLYQLREQNKVETTNNFPEELIADPEIDHEKENRFKQMYKSLDQLGDTCQKIIRFFISTRNP